MGSLNPYAEPFAPHEEERSLFMTFSYGNPISQQELSNYFNSIGYGACIEKVVIHAGREGREPMSGNIVFKSSLLPVIILGTKDVVEIMVTGKPIWLKKFIPRADRVNP